MNKWIGLSLGTLVGISHIGMLGLLMSKDSKLPVIDIPTGNYVINITTNTDKISKNIIIVD